MSQLHLKSTSTEFQLLLTITVMILSAMVMTIYVFLSALLSITEALRTAAFSIGNSLLL